MSVNLDSSIVGQYALQYNTAGNAQASETATRAVESALGIQLSTEQFDSLKAQFMNSQAPNPAGDLPDPDGNLRGATGTSLANMGELQTTADIYACMALFQKLAQQMRDSAREVRTTEAQAKFDSQMGAADKMQQAADKRYEAGLAQGWSQIAGGIAQMGMSAVSMGYGLKSANAMQQNPSTKEWTQTGGDTGSTALGAKGSMWGGAAQSSSGIAGGIGQVISVGLTHEADLKEADSKRLDAQATAHDTAMQQANDMMQQMMDVIRDVRDKLSSMEQASIETNKGIARNV